MNDIFASLLDESPTEVIRPKPLPVGTYKFRVGGYEQIKSDKKGTPGLKFELTPIDYAEDVDEAALEEAGGLEGKVMSSTFWITETALFMLDDFHEKCGIDLTKKNKRRLRNDAVFNAEILGQVKHTISDDGERIYANITKFLPV